jgi:hypothetical protein
VGGHQGVRREGRVMWEPAETFVVETPACVAPGMKACAWCGVAFKPRNSQMGKTFAPYTDVIAALIQAGYDVVLRTT